MNRCILFMLVVIGLGSISLSLGACALTREGGFNRAGALLEFSEREPLNDRFNDPVYYDDTDPNAEILSALDEIDELADRQIEEHDDFSDEQSKNDAPGK